jgi:threonine dehydrogenase-like Zn-dependent dehydrogenase
MRATTVIAPGKVEFLDVPEPTLKPGHALVRPLLLSLCGSDVFVLHYATPDSYPWPVGTTAHEMIGVVEAVDAPGSTIKPGDLALTLAPNHTASVELFLAPIEHVLPLPAGAPLEKLLMAQQLGTVIYGAKRLPSLIGKDVAIVGQGSVGLFFAWMARRMGAERVIGLDLQPARLAVSPRYGVTHTVNNAQVDPLEAVQEITGGRLADVVIEAAGEVDAINLVPHLLKMEGFILFFGVPHAERFVFDYTTFYRKYGYSASVSNAPAEPGCRSFRQALNWIAQGEIDVAPIITHHSTYDHLLETYELAHTKKDGVVKVVIEMPEYRRFKAGS